MCLTVHTEVWVIKEGIFNSEDTAIYIPPNHFAEGLWLFLSTVLSTPRCQKQTLILLTLQKYYSAYLIFPLHD